MFLHALEAAPSPRLRYNAALCAQLAGRLPLSWAAFEEYLAAEDLEPERRAEAQRRMAELSGRLALVDVTTDPPGAMLFLDDRDRGDHGRSPRTLPLARGGAVLVRAELEGHHPAEMRVEVAVGQRRAVHLALAPRMGTLRLRTRPRGAPVLVMRGDRRVAVGGGGDSLELPVGRYRLVTGLEGHEEATADVEVSEGRVEAATLVPRPLPAPSGRLLVDSGHVEAVVEVDGRRVGPTPLALDGVAVGERRVRVRAAGHLPWERTVRVEPDRPAYVNVTLVPAR